MNNDRKLVFPELLYLNDFNGNFQNYLLAAYVIFEYDFIKTQPLYDKIKVNVRKYPEVEGLHRTFYHITHEGEDEQNRTPDIRRMEQIRFPRFVIDNNKHCEILTWRNTRGNDERVLLFNKTENYLVVLTKRKEYYLFITAYYVETEHRKRALLKEHETYIKTKTA
ncbi:MAG: hypothetical protein JW783_02095 [Bacteroidales bacterium]|nr:hypothetical protein [Bacteroidales bacterium]MBN2748334.1 hypothetical protein [Bacteroidales bacterium]